ncbi:MAG: hypothetical protein AB7O57_08300, partial [Hyphomicrobiaceae bacterium]
MPNLLSLDLATKTGWARGDTEAGDPVSGVHKATNAGAELGPFLHSYGHWLRSQIIEHSVTIVVLEEPIMPMGTLQLATLLKLYGLVGITEAVCHASRVQCRQLAAGTWKKAFCGKAGFGKSKKPYPPMVRCLELGWRPSDDNEADALGLFVASCQRISPQAATRFDPLFRVQ